MTRLQISRWGNSSAIRLPKAVLDELGLKQGEIVNLTVEDGKAILEPALASKITLEGIIAEMKRLGAEHEPDLLQWGPDRGEERIEDDNVPGRIERNGTA